MADELDEKSALEFARQLKAIPGFPRDDEVVAAHARYLKLWCKGAILEGERYWPAGQARWLVEEAAPLAWDKWQGPKALHDLFLSKFPKRAEEPKPEWTPLSYEATIAKGLIKPPCEVCDDSLYIGKAPDMSYCTACPAGRRNAKWEGDAGLHRLNCAGRPVSLRGFTAPGEVTPKQMARANEAEEKRRRERDANSRQREDNENREANR
jgi:hypothetical protein